MGVPLYCLHSLFLDAVCSSDKSYSAISQNPLQWDAVLVVMGIFITAGGKSNLQGKVNSHSPTVRLISVLSMKRNV